ILLAAIVVAQEQATPLVALTPTPIPTPTSLATPAIDERLHKVQERKQSLEREVAKLRGEERGLLTQVERLDLEVRLRTEELREVQLVLQRAQTQLDATLKRAEALEREVAAARPLVSSRARALFKLGELSYLRLLLSVERPSSMFQGYRYVTTLARRDNQRIAAFRKDLNALAETRAELYARTGEAQRLRVDLERRRRGLDAERQRKTAFLTQLVERKETHMEFIGELATAEERLRQLLAGLPTDDASVPVSLMKGALRWPVEGRVRIGFGRRKHPRFDTYTIHNGIEIEAPLDTPVASVHDGAVVFVDRFLGYGLMVIIDHGNKHLTLYGHLSDASVKVGDHVTAGQLLGTTGAGLESQGVYFELRSQGKPDDPADWLRKAR
ncbi:MAG: peptidoglycan DD-metalloendopeptidase family protein, partial [Vicinamibacteria bacterium]|nr:peptidoglycan DD-metalloendopeptidase family protein [Vicinamibacteria bacterium]